jgi:hydrogenase maturation factor
MVGDRVLITKGPAIEATGILAHQAEDALLKHLGKETVEKAKGYFFKMSVVDDAMTSAPYAHAMHDATEGGLLNGVYEVAQASGKGVTIYEEKILTPEEVAHICGYFGLDPLVSISEGTLVMAVPPENVDLLIRTLGDRGIPAWEIGEITEKGRNIVRRSGKKEELLPVSVDPFWGAYFSTLEEK